MKKIMSLAFLLSLSACSSFSEEKPDVQLPPQPVDRGEFFPGPYTSPEGKYCSENGGYCTSDKQCHSSAAKCPIIR